MLTISLSFRETSEAISILKDFMRTHVQARRESVTSGQTQSQDVLTLMIKANQEEDVKYPLEDSELVGNVFVMLFAGHGLLFLRLGLLLLMKSTLFIRVDCSYAGNNHCTPRH